MALGRASISIRVTLAVVLAGVAILTLRSMPVASERESEPADLFAPMQAEPELTVAQAVPAPNEAIIVAAEDLAGDAMRMIEYFESRRGGVYTDSRGKHTIGVGFNLDRPGAAEDIARVLPGVTRSALLARRARLTDEQIERLLRHDVERAINTARRQVPNFDELPYNVRLVLVDLCFNVGGLAKWPSFRAAVERRDFTDAARLMHNTRWYRQTGRRAVATTRMMRNAANS